MKMMNKKDYNKKTKLSIGIYNDIQKFVYWHNREEEFIRSFLKKDNKTTVNNILKCHNEKLKYKYDTLEDKLILKLLGEKI